MFRKRGVGKSGENRERLGWNPVMTGVLGYKEGVKKLGPGTRYFVVNLISG